MRTLVIICFVALTALPVMAQIPLKTAPIRPMALDADVALRAQGRAAYRAGLTPQALAAQVRGANPRGGDPAVAAALKGALAEADAEIAGLKRQHDSLSDLSQQDQLRLQMAMDRKNKLETMLSNIMKAASDTQQAIVNNMK